MLNEGLIWEIGGCEATSIIADRRRRQAIELTRGARKEQGWEGGGPYQKFLAPEGIPADDLPNKAADSRNS